MPGFEISVAPGSWLVEDTSGGALMHLDLFFDQDEAGGIAYGSHSPVELTLESLP